MPKSVTDRVECTRKSYTSSDGWNKGWIWSQRQLCLLSLFISGACETYHYIWDTSTFGVRVDLKGKQFLEEKVTICCVLESQSTLLVLLSSPLSHSQSFHHKSIAVGYVGLAVAYSLVATRSFLVLFYQQVLQPRLTPSAPWRWSFPTSRSWNLVQSLSPGQEIVLVFVSIYM